MRHVRQEHWFLGIVFAVLALSTLAWTLQDRTPPSWDPADHLQTSYDYYRPLAIGPFSALLREFFQIHHSYAPLFHLITAGFFLLFGASRLSGIGTNLLALGVLLYSVNDIADSLYAAPARNRTIVSSFQRPGVIAALLAACYHFPAWLLHDAFLDYLLMAMVALGYALLLRADQFHVRFDAVLFGVAAGIGMLTKQTFPFFFVLPCAFLLIRAILRRDRVAITNLVISGAIVVLIASVWYIPHMDDVIGIYRVNASNAAVEHEAPVFSAFSIAYYWVVLCDLQIQVPFFILFVAGVTYSVRRRFRQDWMLYLWILSGIVGFTLIANKDTRYTVPILPAVSLLSVSWLGKPGLRFRTIAAAAIALWAGVSFFNAQWPSEKREVQFNIAGAPIFFLAGNVFKSDHQPLPEDWSIPEIVRASSGRLGVVPNLWELNASNISLYASLLAQGRGAPPLVTVEWLSYKAALDRVDYCNYLVARTHLANAELVAPIEISVDDYLRQHPEKFKVVSVFTLPRSQEVVLYKRLR